MSTQKSPPGGNSKKKLSALGEDQSNGDNPEEVLEFVNSSEEPQKALETDSEDLKAALEKAKNDFLYLQADFDNYKKQAIKERSELIKFGSERLLREILSIVDIFEQALKTELTPESIQSFREGMELTASELKKVLQRFGVSQMDSLGKNFDPALHEALGSEPTDKYSPGSISQVFKEAYKLYDRILRPGQVIVASEVQKAETNHSD